MMEDVFQTHATLGDVRGRGPRRKAWEGSGDSPTV